MDAVWAAPYRLAKTSRMPTPTSSAPVTACIRRLTFGEPSMAAKRSIRRAYAVSHKTPMAM